jgi:predicted 3-demethylubiquinone-9 3-methyltransferase (glyoxalase superfamily)
MITPFLWFNDQAEAAVRFYLSIFKKAKIGKITRYGPAGPGRPGRVMTVSFRLDGREFIALNGGPHYKMSPAISFFVSCDTQKEVDRLWAKLARGGRKLRCGWVTDKFGVTWQIIPQGLGKLVHGSDPVQSQRAMQAMFKMQKINLARIQRACHPR